MHTIDKTLEFCYGHRVWSQTLNGRYSDDLQCACRHLHGHEAKVQVYLQSDELVAGMVTDFRHLEWLKRWVNKHIDHRFLLDRNDPVYPNLVGDRELAPVVTPTGATVAHEVILLPAESLTPLGELMAGYLLLDFVPTSENLSSWFANLVQEVMRPLGVRVSRVDWWETPKSRSSFTPT